MEVRLGYKLRKIWISVEETIKSSYSFANYLFWLIIDPKKFDKNKSHKIENILMIFNGAIGDTYNFIGILNDLKTNYPKLKFFYLCNEQNKNFIKQPYVSCLRELEVIRLIEKNKIDAVCYIGPLKYNRRLFRALRKIPLGVGGDYGTYRDILTKNFSIPLNKRFFYSGNAIESLIKNFNFLGFHSSGPRFFFLKNSEALAENFFNQEAIRNKKIVFMHPGAGTILKALKEKKVPSHKWPSERWAKVADKLIKDSNAQIFFTGTKEEKPLVFEIISKMKSKKSANDLSGKFSIEDLASLFKLGDLLISIDTGIAHIGAQSGISLIDLFGPTSPKLAFPWTKKTSMLFHSEVCNNCRKYSCPEGNPICMKAITLEEVISAAKSFLHEPKSQNMQF